MQKDFRTKNRRRSIFCIILNLLATFGVLVPEEIK